jgi:hypothetical protein
MNPNTCFSVPSTQTRPQTQTTNPASLSLRRRPRSALAGLGIRRAAAILLFLVALVPAKAATLTAVPMQGGMVMPMVSYHADHGHLHVMMAPDIPQLTPLLVSHPSDAFDAGDPWFDALDPSRQGLAFSRRYGFVMDTVTDPLPANTAIWLRKLSGSPELGFYRYAASAPKMWQPIFGTAGSSSALFWSGMMFHPGVTAPPGTNSLTATFEAYLVDTTSGLEVPDSSSGPFTLEWTSLPDGRPSVSIGLKVLVSLPQDTAGYVLESADTLTSANWTTVTNTPVVVDGQSAVLLDTSATPKFFRMRKSE